MESTVKNILIFFAVVLMFFVLQALSSLLKPLVLALLLAMIFQPLTAALIKKNMPKWLILPLIISITLLTVFGLVNIGISTGNEIMSQRDYMLDRLTIRLGDVLNAIGSVSGQTFDKQYFQKEFMNLINSGWLTRAAGNIAGSISSFTGSFVMFALYFIFLMAGMSDYRKYLTYVVGKNNTKGINNVETIQNSIYRYIITKTLINIFSALVITVICMIFGIKFALFWGLLAFLFNFIPNFGSIFSIAMPILMAVIQYDSFRFILIILLVLIVIQFSIGNFIEPKIIGNSLRINTVTVLFGLVFWGYIWGIAGMFLSVPLMVILKLSLERSPSLSIVSRVMGYPD